MSAALEPGNYVAKDGWQSVDQEWKYDLSVEIISVKEQGSFFKETAVEASSSWVLRRGPPDYHKKVGKRAVERTRGLYNPKKKTLALTGYELQDPAGLIDQGEYSLELKDDGRALVGTCEGVAVHLARDNRPAPPAPPPLPPERRRQPGPPVPGAAPAPEPEPEQEPEPEPQPQLEPGRQLEPEPRQRQQLHWWRRSASGTKTSTRSLDARSSPPRCRI